MVNIQELIDDAKCYQTIREMRWPEGVTCPACSSNAVIKNGRDDTQPNRQRYECRSCHQRFDDLTDTIFAGHHQPLRTWTVCLYLMALNFSGWWIAAELNTKGGRPRDDRAPPPGDRRAPPAGGPARRGRTRRSQMVAGHRG